jgi:hypothetical protein
MPRRPMRAMPATGSGSPRDVTVVPDDEPIDATRGVAVPVLVRGGAQVLDRLAVIVGAPGSERAWITPITARRLSNGASNASVRGRARGLADMGLLAICNFQRSRARRSPPSTALRRVRTACRPHSSCSRCPRQQSLQPLQINRGGSSRSEGALRQGACVSTLNTPETGK